MAVSPVTIANGATGLSARTKLNNLITASSRAEDMGFSQTDHAANRTALDTLVNTGGGGTVVFGPYDYDWRWVTSFTRPTHEPITLIGVPGKTRILLDHATVTASGLFALRDSPIILYGIEFVCTGSLGSTGKALVYLSRSDLTADIDLIHIEKCKISGLETVINTTNGSGVTSTYRAKKLVFLDNIVNCRSGAVRFGDIPCSVAEIHGNDVDGAIDGIGGCLGAYGGFFMNAITNAGTGMMPEEACQVRFTNNRVRNIKPTVDPGSSGCYGMLVNGHDVIMMGNTIERVVQWWGDHALKGTTTNASAIVTGLGSTSQLYVGQTVTGTGIPTNTTILTVDSATQVTLNKNATASGTVTLSFATHSWTGVPLATGDGATTIFTGNISQRTGTTTSASAVVTGLGSTLGMSVGMSVSGTGLPTNAAIASIDSATQITLTQNATASGTVTLTFPALLPILDTFTVSAGAVSGTANDQGWFRPGKGIIKGTGLGSTQATMCWIDYNTGAWRLEFTAAPANGQAITAGFKVSLSIVDNIEGGYTKASRSTVIGNDFLDCTGLQGILALKGGGSQNGPSGGGGASTPQTGGYEGGPNSAFGSLVSGNTFYNQVYKGVFASANGIWLQSDYATITGNFFHNISGRVVRDNVAAPARGLNVSHNMIKDFRGPDIVFIVQDWNGIIVADNIVDGLKPNSGTTVDIVDFAPTAAKSIANARIEGTMVLGGLDGAGAAINTATSVNIARTGGSTTGTIDLKISGTSSALAWHMEERTNAVTGGKRVYRDNCVANNLDNATAGSTSPTRQFLSGSGAATASLSDDGGHI